MESELSDVQVGCRELSQAWFWRSSMWLSVILHSWRLVRTFLVLNYPGEKSTVLPFARSASQEKAASKSMAPDTPSGQENLQQKSAFQASVSWSTPPSRTGWKICQVVIPTTWCPCTSHSKMSGMPRFLVCTLQVDPAEKDKFYLEFRCCLQSTPVDDKVIILGDFNARVDQDADSWRGVLGRHGVGNCNDNGRLQLELCTERQLVITNTIFRQTDRLKTTWMYPQAKHWPLIDYVLVHKRDLMDVIHTKVMPSAECNTNHRLVGSKLRLHFKPRSRKGGLPKKKFNLKKNFRQLHSLSL